VAKPSSFRRSAEPYSLWLGVCVVLVLSCAEEADDAMRPERPYVPPPTLDASASRLDAGSDGALDAARASLDATTSADTSVFCEADGACL
jgi:hypothetical protein